MDNRPNFFILLGLPSNADEKAIRDAIDRKRGDWSRDQNDSRKGLKAQQSLQMMNKIKAVMEDADERAKESAASQSIRKQMKDERWQKTDQTIEVLVKATGSLLEAQLGVLLKQYNDGLEGVDKIQEAELRDRIKVPIRKDVDDSKSSDKPLVEKSKYAKIVSCLQIIGSKDLYDFLGMPRTSSSSALLKRARQLGDEVRLQKVNVDKTAKQELIGSCLVLFKEEQTRKTYDNSLEEERLADLDPILEAAAAANGEVQAAVFEQLLQRARESGASPEDARRYIKDFATKRKWSMEVPGEIQAVRMQRCGKCMILNSEKATRCSNCSEPLTVSCPRCQTANPSDSAVCSKCDFPVGDGFEVRRLQRDAELLIARGDFTNAEAPLNEADVLWPSNEKTRTLRDRIKRAQAEEANRIKRAQAEKTKTLEGVRKAHASRQLFEARRLMEEAKTKYPGHPVLAELHAKIEAGIKRAQTSVAKGRASERLGRIDDALDAYLEALKECKDYKEAKEGVDRCPPERPGALQAHASDSGIRVEWQASPSRGLLQYRVVRKAGSPSRSPTDGTVLAEKMAGLSFTDQQSEPGEWYYYAVFTERGGIFSRLAATSEKPSIRACEVTNVRPRAGNRAVVLEWVPPAKVRRIEVWRQLHSEPRGRMEGAQVVGVTRSGATDQQLSNGSVYGYRIVAVYDGPDGPQFSKGVTCSVSPCEPPEPVGDLHVTRGEAFFEARWTAPPKGQVALYALKNRPTCRKCDLLALPDLDSFGTPVPSQGPQAARGPIPAETEMHLLPVTILGSVAVAGEPISVSWIDDVTDLTGTCKEQVLHLQWRWSNNTRAVVVVYRTDAFPEGPEDPRAKSVPCFHEQYQLTGSFRQPVAECDRVYVVVYSRLNRNGIWHYSPGGPSARRAIAAQQQRRAYYRIEAVSNGLFRQSSQYQLVLTTDKPTVLPALTLVHKRDGWPQSPTEGDKVALIPEGRTIEANKPLTVRLDHPGALDARKTRLFCVHDEDYQWLELVSR